MAIDFSLAKNGQITCSVSNFFLHSKYNPENEAKKWVETIECNFKPKLILVLGCTIPYCLKYLKEKFSGAQIDFIEYDSESEKFFGKNSEFQTKLSRCITIQSLKKTSENQFCEELFALYGEELSSSLLVISWQPAEKIFEGKFTFAYNAIKLYIKKSQDVIATRIYFQKKWFENSIRFVKYAKNFCTVRKVSVPIVVCASGPTLKDSFETLKKFRKNFFLLAVSSSVLPLLKNQIVPDLIMSTDGGYWAKRHLDILQKYEIPLMISTESAVPYKILKKQKIIPIKYDDKIQNIIFDLAKIPYVVLNRNGSVSGNAVEFALKLTDKNVFTCGLDLENVTGFVHIQPNSLEKINSQTDFRLKNLETRIAKSNFSSGSLQVYKNWFENLGEKEQKRIFRLCSNKNFLPNLKNIKTLDLSEFEKNADFVNFPQNDTDYFQTIQNACTNCEKIKEFFIKYLEKIEEKSEKNEIFTENEIEFLKTFALGEVLLFEKYQNYENFKKAIQKTREFYERILY